MEELKTMKQQFISAVQGELAKGINRIDAHEMGEVIDMIKDLSEAIYYCSVTDAMYKSSQEDKDYYMEKYLPSKYYTPYPRYYDDYHRDVDRYNGRMYFTEPKVSKTIRTNYSDRGTSWDISREGRSPMSRRMFIEMKENGSDSESSMKELEHYMKDLSEDIVDMIESLSEDERVIVKQKLASLANKIA